MCRWCTSKLLESHRFHIGPRTGVLLISRVLHTHYLILSILECLGAGPAPGKPVKALQWLFQTCKKESDWGELSEIPLQTSWDQPWNHSRTTEGLRLLTVFSDHHALPFLHHCLIFVANHMLTSIKWQEKLNNFKCSHNVWQGTRLFLKKAPAVLSFTGLFIKTRD